MVVKYSTSAIPNTIKTNNIVFGLDNADYGPTSTSGFWNGIDPPSSGYTIYTLTESRQEPSIVVAHNDAEAIYFAKSFGGTNINTINDAINYFLSGSSYTTISNMSYPNIVTDGLVLNLDAGFISSYPKTGNYIYDLSGNNNTGTLYNSPTYDTSYGGSLVFDGTNKGIYVINNDSINFGTGSFTIEMMVNLNTLDQYFLNKAAFGGGRGYAFTIVGGTVYFGIQGDANYAAYSSVSTLGLTIGNNFHIILICNQTTDRALFYINGTQKDDQDISGQIGTTTGSATLYVLSQYEPGYYPYQKRYFTRLYNKALTPSEVTQNYNAIKGRFGL